MLKITLDNKLKGNNYLVTEKGYRSNKNYRKNNPFLLEQDARKFYHSTVFHAHGEYTSPEQVKSLRLYKKRKSFFKDKVIVWKPLEERINLNFNLDVYDPYSE